MADVTITAVGRVNQVGFYGDCMQTLAVFFKKDQDNASLVPPGERVKVLLTINGSVYHAGLRTTEKMPSIKLCPDLIDENGGEVRLVDILLGMGIQNKSNVSLAIVGLTVTLDPA